MDLKAVLSAVWRWWWLMAVGALGAAAAVFLWSSMTPPVYVSATTFLIDQAPASNAAPDYNTLLADERLARIYAEILHKHAVLDAVIADRKLTLTADTLAKRVSVAVLRDTHLIEVTVEDTDAGRAADIANTIVQVFDQQNQLLQTNHYAAVQRTMQQQLTAAQNDLDQAETSLAALNAPATPQQTEQQTRARETVDQRRSIYADLQQNLNQVRLAELQTIGTLRIIEAAQPASAPVRPRTKLNTVLGGIVGMLLMLGIVFVKEYLDDTIKSGDDIERTLAVPILASIGRMQRTSTLSQPVMLAQPASAIAEAYRVLQIGIEFAAVDHPIRRILVTSGGQSEGKSTTAANLAVAIARSGKQVILVDTDLRRPTLHTLFQRSNPRGVTTALLAPTGCIEDHLVPTDVATLRLMPSGPLPPNPAELIGSRRMAELIEALTISANIVIFDSPPTLAVVDAALLAHSCDATVLVVRAAATKIAAAQHAKERITQAGARLLGVVLNGIASTSDYQIYYPSQVQLEQGAARIDAQDTWSAAAFAGGTLHTHPKQSIAVTDTVATIEDK